MESNNIKEYTIYDFFSRKKYFMKYCYQLTKTYSRQSNKYIIHEDKAEDIFSDTVLELLETVFKGGSKSFNSISAFECFVKVVIKRRYIRTVSNIHKGNKLINNTTYYEDILSNNEEENLDEGLSHYLGLSCNSNAFNDFDTNINIQNCTLNLDKKSKRIIKDLYLGYSQIEISRKLRLNTSTVNTRLRNIRELLKSTELCQ